MIDVGILLPTRESVMNGRPATGPMLALAEQAERLGFSSVWVGDSLTARPRHEPLTLLAAVAARTRRVALGTAVLLPALRHPLVLAHLVATVDRISEGRLVLGVGIAGDTPATRKEFDAAGVPFNQRAGRCIETLDICRALWRGETLSFQGRYWTLDGIGVGPTPHRPGGPLIWWGGGGPTALREAGRSHGWFPIDPRLELFQEGWRRVQSAARDAGRSPQELTAALYTTIVLGEPAKAQAEIEQFLSNYYNAPAAAMLKRQACYAGQADGCLEWMDRFVENGVRHILIRFAGASEQMAQLERAAHELLPRLNRLG
ncbi:MAG TPA: LLM class flavin-dependent oxidoreductase [Candidatus Methylomirabilis sp.]|nr:LLM class flavin-dependent oxidoreductase [Candidatus Methylomirabilis sp.]